MPFGLEKALLATVEKRSVINTKLRKVLMPDYR